MENEKPYKIRDWSSNLTPGRELKIERSICVSDYSKLPSLINIPEENLHAMRDGSAAAEQAIFEKLQEAAKDWDTHGAQTRQLDMALQYAKTPQTKHRSNEWKDAESGWWDVQEKSNMVYKMIYRVSKNNRYGNCEQVSWCVMWQVSTNPPPTYGSSYGSGVKIAGQIESIIKTNMKCKNILTGA